MFYIFHQVSQETIFSRVAKPTDTRGLEVLVSKIPNIFVIDLDLAIFR